MLVTKTLITIQQVTPFGDKVRNKRFTANFINEGEIVSTWVNLTDTAKLTFPKNIYFLDEHDNPFTWFDKSVIASNDTLPILLRGDKINIQLGYASQDDNGNETIPELNEEFDGFITKINPQTPIQIECEDRMWKLKQVKAPNKVYSGDVQAMLKDMIASDPSLSDIVVSTGNVTVNIGSFRTQNETIAEVLHRLQKDIRIYSYFRKVNGVYELRSGLVYYPQDRVQRVYHFQKNIHEQNQNLEYQRQEDLNIGIKAYSILNEEIQVVNEDATKKTKKKRLEVFVDKNGKSIELGFQGEIITRFYFDAQTEDQLVTLAKNDLKKYYYTGLKGSFDTFCLPFVKHGDEAVLQNDILKEFNGSYLVKGVTTTFGMNGHHKKIQLHLRIDGIYKDAANGV